MRIELPYVTVTDATPVEGAVVPIYVAAFPSFMLSNLPRCAP